MRTLRAQARRASACRRHVQVPHRAAGTARGTVRRLHTDSAYACAHTDTARVCVCARTRGVPIVPERAASHTAMSSVENVDIKKVNKAVNKAKKCSID